MANPAISGLDSALENAIQERFDLERRSMPERMAARIGPAEEAGWLSPAGARAARDVWFRGNKAGQRDPEVVKDVHGTIEFTMIALRDLYATFPGESP